MTDKKDTPKPKPRPKRQRRLRVRRDCPECFLEHGHEPWCKKSE